MLKYIVAPVLEKCGYETPVRADHITQPGVITTQVFTHLWNDDLVVADLTGGNPNVFYELAVRHMRRTPFVHLVEAGARIPFDVALNRTIEFCFDVEKAELAKAALQAMVMAAPDAPASIQTPLSAAVDLAIVETSADPLKDAIAQILSAVQEIKGMIHRAQSPTVWGRVGGDTKRVRDAVLERFSTKLRELGVSVQSMGMPVEVTGGITIHFGNNDVEVSIG
ncbi:MAG: hypothetical protein ACRD9L_24645, partial [Bryobacteraceae bacterium]